jgi:hypothetical protein
VVFSWELLLWRECGSVIYSYKCYWAMPAQSLSGSSPAELVTTSYCLMTLMTRRATVWVFQRTCFGNTYTKNWLMIQINVKVILLPTICPGMRPPSGTRDQFFSLTQGICLQTAAVWFSLLWGAPSDERSGLSFSQSETVVVSPLSVRTWVFQFVCLSHKLLYI